MCKSWSFITSFQDESLLFLFSCLIDLAGPSIVTLLNKSGTSKQVCLNPQNLFGFTHEIINFSEIDSLSCS